MGNLFVVNQLTLTLDGKQTLIFQGDIFDHIIHISNGWQSLEQPLMAYFQWSITWSTSFEIFLVCDRC